MACDNWEQAGLLYTADELSSEERARFSEHLSTCDECRAQYQTYVAERKSYYSVDILGECPSVALDTSIIRVCSTARRFTSLGFVGVLVSKPVAAALFLLVGLGTGGYLAYHADNARAIAASKAAQTNPVVAVDSSTLQAPAILASKASTPTDSSARSADSSAGTQPFPRTSGSVSGVIPVDLTKQR